MLLLLLDDLASFIQEKQLSKAGQTFEDLLDGEYKLLSTSEGVRVTGRACHLLLQGLGK